MWFSAITALLLTIATSSADDMPNLVILFADNLGYDDVSVFQSGSNPQHTKTPNIDNLAVDGMKFLNWNSAAALCSASRSALLTGRYPVRTGVYPRVFRPDAKYGLLPEERTIAEMLKEFGYATKIVGKWHLGHREPFLPTNQGFDSWLGVPYHMSGGSIDNHTCHGDVDGTMLLPLYRDASIEQQPVQLDDLALQYASESRSFIQENSDTGTPFFLYMAFSHVHQLCAPRDMPEQRNCQWADKENATFSDSVEEMDWIAGEVLKALDDFEATNNTLVLFTSDNGPWVAEKACSGSKGPFTAEWFRDHSSPSCTACPHDYVPQPTDRQPRRCVLPGTELELEGVPCGEDSGLGSVWEANLRMPALARFPGKIPPGSVSQDLISTLDAIPSFLSLLEKPIPPNLDGEDMSGILTGKSTILESERVLFFWRDGFESGPLPPPYGRFDVAAVKYGSLKAWIWTKSAHYNDDIEQHHDPPLLFDVLADPAESKPLDARDYMKEIEYIKDMVEKHKQSVDLSFPLCLDSDPSYLPCVNRETGCRTPGGTLPLETKL